MSLTQSDRDEQDSTGPVAITTDDDAIDASTANGALLARVMRWTREYVHLDDPGPYYFALAVATSSALDDNPLWGMLVGPASSGKTEAIRIVDHVAVEHVDTLSPASLLNWDKPNPVGTAVPKGILMRVGERGLITIKDFSTVMAGGSRGQGGQRDDLFSMLRAVFDGSLQRDLANGGGNPLRWEGRVTLLSACTPAIDSYSAYSDALGPRWVYLRLVPKNTKTRRAVMRKAFGTNPSSRRKVAANLAERLCHDAATAATTITLSDDFSGTIEDAALTLCWGRASVPRDSYGQREIIDVTDMEEPARVAKQLHMLARCLLAIGLTEQAAQALVCRVAFDTMTATRGFVLGELASATGPITTADIARGMKTSWKVAQRAIEDYEALGLVRRAGRSGFADAVEGSEQAKPWVLDHEDAALVQSVHNHRVHAMPRSP